MPWKGEKDPYKIWLSEIILQQTRVDQGLNYYKRFVVQFPNIKKLAQSPEEKIFKLWEGLGYYTRCKNLIATAKYIASENDGKFPDTYQEILALKGVGPYTAAAIASFAFNLPYAVVDGNVFRVLSRFFGIDIPVDTPAGKNLFTILAQELVNKKMSGIYNQAIMDFGAVVCKPKNPLCAICPLETQCRARLQDKINLLPVKIGKLVKRSRWFYYLIIEHKSKIYIRKRGPKDIWENLYEFVLLEAEKSMSIAAVKKSVVFKTIAFKNEIKINSVSKIYKQQLTHQTIQGQFIQLKVKNALQLKEYTAISQKDLSKLALPKFITGYLSENPLNALKR